MQLLSNIPTLDTGSIIFRLVVAAALGGAIGVERELRDREAGLRTHLLVSAGSALFTLVSADGFNDFLVGNGNILRTDPPASPRRSSPASVSSVRARSFATGCRSAGSRPPQLSGSSPRSAWRRAPATTPRR